MGKLTPSSIRGIPESVRGSILPLIAFAFSFLQFSSTANTPTVVGSPANSGCIASENKQEQPLPDSNNSPDSTTDLDDRDGSLDELSADTTTRSDQETPWFTTTTPATIALHRPGFVPAFLFLTHSSDSLHENIRERAPPGLT